MTPVQSVVGYISNIFDRADVKKKMVIETVVMMNNICLRFRDIVSTWLLVGWNSIFQFFPTWQVGRGRIEMYHSQHLSVPQGTLWCRQQKAETVDFSSSWMSFM